MKSDTKQTKSGKKESSAPKKNIDIGKETIRLNKFIADSGYCSRRKADELIKNSVVKVNQKIISEPGTQVYPGDFITVKGDPISLQLHGIYIILNKPKNIITTTSDDKGRRTVLDIVRKQSRIFPIGRLDRNTTGVLLLTNDGELSHRLTHPSYEVLREYYVKLDKQLNPLDAEKIAKGIVLEDGKTAPCELLIHPEDKTKVSITLTEGKNHEVIRLFDAVGYQVKQLDRKMFAGITYKGLNKGEYRHLTKKEVLYVKKLVKL